MKYYVNFTDWTGMPRCHCFENAKEEAEHFAKLVDGSVFFGYQKDGQIKAIYEKQKKLYQNQGGKNE